MDSSVIVAIVTAGGSVAVALVGMAAAIRASRKAKVADESVHAEHAYTVAEVAALRAELADAQRRWIESDRQCAACQVELDAIRSSLAVLRQAMHEAGIGSDFGALRGKMT